jgi:hypothetical protein
MSSPPSPLFLLFFFLPVLSLVRPRAAGFLPPRPRIVAAGARRCCQGWPLFSGHPPPGGSGLYSNRARRHAYGSGRLILLSVTCDSVFVSARYSDHGRVAAGLATNAMARAMFASTYIRQLRSGLPRCCLHGRSRRRDGAHLSNGRSASADLRCPLTATHPTRPTRPTGVSELSALSTLSREGRSLRNETLLEIAPEGNGELARHCNDHDALNAPGLPFGPFHEPLGNRALGLMFDP